MFKLLLALKAFLVMFTNSLTPPEIWAEPIPYFLENQMRTFVVPHSERGPGHRGVDFASTNQQILAPSDGVISFNARVADRNVVTLTADGYKVSFEPVCSALDVGAFVRPGEVLGHFCEAENDYLRHCDNCVHMSVRSERGYLNPLLFFGQLPPSKIVG
jgi:hypothetical protein